MGYQVSHNSVSLEMLKEDIEIVRNRMQQIWNEKGCTDTEVINASIELDDLINEYQRRNDLRREVALKIR